MQSHSWFIYMQNKIFIKLIFFLFYFFIKTIVARPPRFAPPQRTKPVAPVGRHGEVDLKVDRTIGAIAP